jgi:hypothetical protein
VSQAKARPIQSLVASIASATRLRDFMRATGAWARHLPRPGEPVDAVDYSFINERAFM